MRVIIDHFISLESFYYFGKIELVFIKLFYLCSHTMDVFF